MVQSPHPLQALHPRGGPVQTGNRHVEQAVAGLLARARFPLQQTAAELFVARRLGAERQSTKKQYIRVINSHHHNHKV
jgi:hypothetical protein